jgi:predicted HAD superfamily Cof-like phosphohydrolase
MSKERTLNEYRQNKDYGYNPPTKGARFEVPKYDPQTGELNPYYEKLTGNKNPYQLELEFEYQTDVPFVNEVEEFNRTFGKPNNYEPTIPEEKEWQFVYDFVLEELEEYRQACQNGDIVEILDALCDIAYVSLGNGVMLHGLKDKIWPAYQEVQASNMSKSCSTEEEAMETITIRSKEQAEPCHFKQVGDRYVVYRSRDKKVMKSINYFRPDLTQFFTNEELARTKFDNLGI